MTRPVDSTTSHSWKNAKPTLTVLTKSDVQAIIRLAESGDERSSEPRVISASDITPENMRAHTERKRNIMDAIDEFGDEGRAELNAIMLYGRGDPGTDDFGLLIQHSRNATSDYIASKSPLARYLSEGLLRLGL